MPTALGVLQRPTQQTLRGGRGILRGMATPAPGAAALARRLACSIADAADADQWAIAVVGLRGTGAPDFEEQVPRHLLETMNDAQPARYRMTLVLQADGRDLGVVRLGTLRPSGFSAEDVQRGRAAAETAAHELAETLDGEQASPPEPQKADGLGVVILDPGRHIRLLTRGAEELLGWRSDDVVGRRCRSVFDCRDERGESLCARCGLASALKRKKVTPAVFMRMADVGGGRQVMSTGFWYLPPAGRIQEERVMAVLHAAATVPGPGDASLAG